MPDIRLARYLLQPCMKDGDMVVYESRAIAAYIMNKYCKAGVHKVPYYLIFFPTTNFLKILLFF